MANTTASLEVFSLISVLFDEHCNMPQIIKIYYGCQLLGNKAFFISFCIKLIYSHIDPKETKAGPGQMPSHAGGGKYG